LFYSTRSKLIIGILVVSLLVGSVSLLVGGQLLYKAFVNEATRRIRLDLNAAREIYLNRLRSIRLALDIATLGTAFPSAVQRQNISELRSHLRRVAESIELDFAGVVQVDGKALCRIGPNPVPNEGVQETNPIAKAVLERGATVAGTVVLDQDFLMNENPVLARRARIELIATPRAAPGGEREVTMGMALASAVPVFDDGVLVGALYGGILLNRSHEIVDRVRETVFQQEIYKGRSIGTATIFLRDIRISTNVMAPNGERAIGTRVSQEVRDRVLEEGKRWTDRAFVVSDWYITAYEPIRDVFGERVGILYVGVLEAKYADIRGKALSLLILITGAGMVLAVGIGYILANKIIQPVHQLIRASREVSRGNLSPEVGPISSTEIGVLQKTFKEMLGYLQECDARQRAESEHMLLQSEKQASIGKLAGGVAHEINNPLTGILTYTHMLLRRKDIGEDIRSDLQTIAEATERVRKIVKGLLDFSRQTKLDPEPTDVNRLVRSSIALLENQALIRGVDLNCEPGEGLPMVTLDRSRLQSVLLNIIINAFDATKPGDTITVTTTMIVSTGNPDRKEVEISVTDTGCGIPPENLDRLFDPFFTTKEVGQGTGLGLAVSYGIVERHGGTIRVQSKVGQGSTFTIQLPVQGMHGEK
jgi:two-component system NtrC family sensor kinase